MNPIIPRPSRRFWWRSLAAASILWLGLGTVRTPSPLPVTEAVAAAPKRTAAYVYDKAGLTFYDRDAQNLDQLIFSFALIKNGEVSASHWQSIGAYQAYVSKHPHIVPVVAIGGWGADGFSQASATESGRAKFVKSIVSLMNKYGFLGVDIDWEYPGISTAGIASSPKDGENFVLLLKDLRAALDEQSAQDGKQRYLTVALGAADDLVKRIDCKAVGQVVDQVNVMTYDLHTSRVASHHTALYSSNPKYPASVDAAVRTFANAGIPKSKMMIGAAFYGRTFTLTKQSDAPVFAAAKDSGSKSLSYTKLLDKLESATVGFDEKAKAPYAVAGSAFYTYDDPASIRHKGAYVLQNGLMGMMCWEYGGDSTGELLDAMRGSMT